MGMKRKIFYIVLCLGVVLLGFGIVSLSFGTAAIPVGDIVRSITRPETVSSEARAILWEIRFPRLLAAALVGGGLALSGLVFQALLKNPLADPFILGISSGAALGTVVASVLGGTAAAILEKIFAFVGAMLTVLIVFYVARVKERLYPHTMLLTGVIINAFFSASIIFLFSVFKSGEMESVFFWLMGDLSVTSIKEVGTLFAITCACFVAIYYFSFPLNLLLGGEELALTLGVEVERVKKVLFVIASLLAAAVVSAVGVIGFVGLIIPHMVRMVIGSDHRLVIPASFLLGASFLVISDICSRLLVSPIELPVGVITAILGAPFFIYLLRRAL